MPVARTTIGTCGATLVSAGVSELAQLVLTNSRSATSFADAAASTTAMFVLSGVSEVH